MQLGPQVKGSRQLAAKLQKAAFMRPGSLDTAEMFHILFTNELAAHSSSVDTSADWNMDISLSSSFVNQIED